MLKFSGGCGDGQNITGFIHVNADSEIGLNSTGLENQTVCEGEAIDPIIFQVAGGATGAVLEAANGHKWRWEY